VLLSLQLSALDFIPGAPSLVLFMAREVEEVLGRAQHKATVKAACLL
jgi:hypothetical protein